MFPRANLTEDSQPGAGGQGQRAVGTGAIFRAPSKAGGQPEQPKACTISHSGGPSHKTRGFRRTRRDHQPPSDLGLSRSAPSPCPRCCDLLAPGLTPSAERTGVGWRTPFASPQPPPCESPARAPGSGWGSHLVLGEHDGSARARGPVLAPVGGDFEVGVGDPEFVGRTGHGWGGGD